LSTPFQNRVVGTVIVAAITIIFLPDFLDGNKKKYNAEFEDIPQAPKIELNTTLKAFPTHQVEGIKPKIVDVVEVEQDDMLELTSKAVVNTEGSTLKSNNTTAVLSTDTVKVNTLKKPNSFDKPVIKKVIPEVKKKIASFLPKKINVKESWVIQLGSFKHKKNVLELIEKLKYYGYTTFTRPIKTKNGTLTKVFIGPNISKASLESKIKPLKDLTHVQGKVTRFYPTK